MFLMLAGGFNYADRAALTTVLPALRTEMHLTNVDLGLLSSLFFWSYAIGSPIAGMFGDRFPRRKLVLGSLVAWSAVTLLTGMSRNFFELAVLRVALGFAECIYIPTAVALLMDQHSPATRGRAVSLGQIGFSFGTIIGGTLCGVLADRFGWRTGFWVLGLAGGVLALSSRTFLGSAPPVALAAPAPRRIAFGEPVAYFLRTRTYLMILGSLLLINLGNFVFVAWLPLYFSEKYHMGMGAAGFHGTFIIQAFAPIGVVCGGWLSDRVAKIEGRRRLFFLGAGYFLAGPCLLSFVAGLPFVMLYVFIGLFAFLRACGGANETPVMCEVVPPAYRSTAQGLQNACSVGAGGVGILLTGVLKGSIGLETIFAAVSILYLSAGVLYVCGYVFWIRHDTERAKRREEELRQS